MKENYFEYQSKDEFWNDVLVSKGLQEIPKKLFNEMKSRAEKAGKNEYEYEQFFEKDLDLVWKTILALKDNPKKLNTLKPQYGWNMIKF